MYQIENHQIGFELEYENCDVSERSDELNKELGRFGEIKDDGSLSYGFELASNVFRMSDFFSLSDSTPWIDLFNKVSKLGGQAQHNTGMHIHVSRSGLTDDEIAKINYFIFSSRAFMNAIGGRDENNWCLFIRNLEENIVNKNGHKYCYLNVGHANTIEFRFFRTPETVEHFLKNMQFAISVVEFVKLNNANALFYRDNNQENLIRYINFVYDNKDRYAHLHAHLEIYKKDIENGAISVERELNCDIYPNQRVKQTISNGLRIRYPRRVVTPENLNTVISKLSPEKSPITVEYLNRVLNRASKRKVSKIYFNNLPTPTS